MVPPFFFKSDISVALKNFNTDKANKLLLSFTYAIVEV